MNMSFGKLKSNMYTWGAILLVCIGIYTIYVYMGKNTQVSAPSSLVKEVQGIVATEQIDFEENEKGVYEAYAPEKLSLSKNHTVILFFKADWCPTCVVADTALSRDFAVIPKDIAILKVSFDTETELRKKYGVTVQHTFVQVDGQGNMVTKWTGGNTISSILEKIR